LEQVQLLHSPPAFCQYAGEACDKDFNEIVVTQGLFLYPSNPKTIAATIEAAKKQLDGGANKWRSWSDLDTTGRIIYCEICKAMRGATTVFADVTTLNFNVLFEIGFCIGLGVPVRPIRDSTYGMDKRKFEDLGVLDTLGYIDFSNADELAEQVRDASGPTLGHLPKKTYRESPVYVLKGPVATQGTVTLMPALKKSRVKFREHDPGETPQTSLHAQWKQIHGSFGVIANLLTPKRDAALTHNALCAFLCGIAMAEQKAVLLLQEEEAPAQPIDYRELILRWSDPDKIPGLITPTINQVFERMQDVDAGGVALPSGILEQVDFGAPAAENEIAGLQDYFVQTGQFRLAAQGHGRLVVGRKGAGKTAMFYGVRQAVRRGHETLVLDLKPEGFQFTRLREAVLEELSPGQQEQTVSAFWTYVLLAEIAHKILRKPSEYRAAELDPKRFESYQALEKAYFVHELASEGDLSRRLLRQIDRLADRFGGAGDITARTDLAELVYGGDIRSLNDAVAAYVAKEKDELWLLIDNLDKSWATRGATAEDILIVSGLLEATGKLEHQLRRKDVDFHCLVFIRTDVLERLNQSSPDRGKETSINLEWDDPLLFRDIIRRRIVASTDLDGDFDELWRQIAEPLVGIEDSFNYIIHRTLMRPRDLLMFVQRAQQVALSRSHERITAEDIQHAEIGYSEEALLWMGYEMEDTHPGISDSILAFQGAVGAMSREEVTQTLTRGNVELGSVDHAVDLLLWFGFLGVRLGSGEELYAHAVHFSLRRLNHPVEAGNGKFVIHPTFRVALGIQTD